MKRYYLTCYLALTTIVLIFTFTGCYNDSEEFLYPDLNGGDCDTTSVTFSNSVKPITDAYCVSCHGGSVPSGNVKVESYNDIKSLADDDRLVNVINGLNGYPVMPEGSKLPDCLIKTIERWVEAGAPNN